MAPVKRTTTAAQRETRTTRAATLAKKRVAADEKTKIATSPNRAPSSSTMPLSTTRRTRKQEVEEQPPQSPPQTQEKLQSSNDVVFETKQLRVTRASVPSSRSAAAPRRRIKVTPLDGSAKDSKESVDQTKSTRSKTKDKEAPKGTSKLSKDEISKTRAETVNDVPDESKPRSTRKSTTKARDEKVESVATVAKKRGRPKTVRADDKISVVSEPETTVTARTTRSQYSESSPSSEAVDLLSKPPTSRATTGARKKVTFKDLPNELDKENQPLSQVKAKSGSSKKAIESTKTATGLRAKPIRKAASVTSSIRGRKTKSVSEAAAIPAAAENANENEKTKLRQPRVLTPKKITQVNRSSSPEREDERMSENEDEDELNGGKTPIRDLSVSPRRPPTAAMARALSPAKKLDFGQSLVQRSPDKTAVFRDTEIEQTGVLASPARRRAAPPFTDAIKASPRRGLNDTAHLLFPMQTETSASITCNPLNGNQSDTALSTMLQSPKRIGNLDPNFFSQSAMKKSNVKSPLKSSLFGSPAKRLFSPAKAMPTPRVTDNTEQTHGRTSTMEQPTERADDVESEVVASSHFRSSQSPLRVMRMELDAGALDFDDSILQVRSPWKVNNPLVKSSVPASLEVDPNINMSPQSHMLNTSDTTQPVKPADIDETQDQCIEAEAEVEGDILLVDPHTQEEDDDAVNPTGKPDSDQQKEHSDTISRPDPARRDSISQLLFRSNRMYSDEESSEDELTGEKTPVQQRRANRPRNVDDRTRDRISNGVPSKPSGDGFGFTPLAAQMSGWLASSPEKSPEQQSSPHMTDEVSGFSPLARQHIEGEVVISRNATPLQRLDRQSLMRPLSSSKLRDSSRKSLDLRKSLAQRQSFGLSSSIDSPARNPLFDEYMEIRALEEQADSDSTSEESLIGLHEDEFDSVNDTNDPADISDHDGETILEDSTEQTGEQCTSAVGDLTTDLINFTHASDTAMIDFQQLAHEADNLASDKMTSSIDTSVDNNDCNSIDEVERAEASADSVEAVQEAEIDSAPEFNQQPMVHSLKDDHEEVSSPVLQPVSQQLDSPSILVIADSVSPPTSPSSALYSSTVSPAQETVFCTPKLNLRVNERRAVNTVVSKVPLKPEGSVSPIKVIKKRSRSVDYSGGSPAKRVSVEALRSSTFTQGDQTSESPDRSVRTSVAPSPGGTSTPALSRIDLLQANRYSFGAATTPGQMSFAVDDFGDSTLDGIELPEDFETTEIINSVKSPLQSENEKTCTSAMQTPKVLSVATPVTTRRSGRRVTTPAVSTKKTPKTARKTITGLPTDVSTTRTPLQAVGSGVLHGATVFVDVHTSEGADASGIFVELLVQMGAKCVREWRWNPRSSLAPDNNSETSEPKIGITHVVYKDGSKRTLEKVRDARGEVCCVGVAWVLDCERENKWIDESNYMVDTKIVPRGGSNRRKSMEPRALLINNDGSVSASRARRSVSAEMNELMKRELINTPARGQNIPADYNVQSPEENDENIEQATPTGFISYDPRTAMTPGTPYLVSQGKKLTQMSAPPKQQNKSLFEDDEDEENEDSFVGRAHGSAGAVKEAQRFRMKNLGDMAKRRRTLGWKPNVRSPLGKS